MLRRMLLVLVVLAPLGAAAQAPSSKMEIFGGYTFSSTDLLETPEVVPGTRGGLNGFTTAFTWNAAHNVGFTAEFGGSFGSQELGGGKADARVYSFLFGPKMVHHADKFEMFVHALFGANHVSIKQGTLDATDTAFAFEGGGGLDYVANQRWAVRVMQVDYMMGQAYGSIENHLKVSGGVVVRF